MTRNFDPTKIVMKTVVITGATSGVGLAFLERLLLETRFQILLNICILCRNERKGEAVKSALKLTHKTANIRLIDMDCENIQSVINAAQKIRKMYDTIDYLYCNAGILPISHLHIGTLLKSVFQGELLKKLTTGHDIFSVKDSITTEKLNRVFATNAFSHFVLIQELLPILASNTGENYAHIIWTTSMAADKKYFCIDNLMCKNGINAYASSKYLINCISVAINQKYNSKNLYSSLAEPGTLISGINRGFVPDWLLKVAMFIFCCLRIFLPSLCVFPCYSAEALLLLFKRNPSSLKKSNIYKSMKGFISSAYVEESSLNICTEEAVEVYDKLTAFETHFREEIAQFDECKLNS